MKGYAAAIPAYEAAPSVGDVVRRTLPILSCVLVVDDGSKDMTGEEARRAGAEVHRFPKNRGKGAALLAAFEMLFARGVEGVVTLDADGQHLPEEIPRLLEMALRADLVLGTRDHLFSEMSGLRHLSNRLSSRIISIVAGCPLPDVQTGFRFYSHHLFETTGFPEKRFDAESAVVVRAARRGLRIATVPVRLARADGRTTSHFRPLADGLLIARAVVRARLTTPR
jgi:glycosyltransferase involved in cell wall biosynthesis